MAMRSVRIPGGCLACLALAAVAACAPPLAFRRTALIPAPYLPSRTGEPLGEFEVRMQGEANPVRLGHGHEADAAEVGRAGLAGEPGLLVPRAEVGGSAYFAPTAWLELGGQFHWASYRWARATTGGVLDFPEGRRSDAWQAGVGARLNLRVRRADLTFSPLFELNAVRVPEAEFIDPSVAYPGQGYAPGWVYTRTRTSTWCYPSAFLQVDKGFLDSTLHLHFLAGFQRTLENVGFDWVNRERSTVSGALVIPVGIGLEYRYRRVVVGVAFFYPVALGHRLDVDEFGPSLALRLGAVLGGRPARQEAPSPEEAPAAAPPPGEAGGWERAPGAPGSVPGSGEPVPGGGP